MTRLSAEPHEALKINISDDAALLRPITHTGPRFYVAAAILLGITGLGVYAYLQQYSRGLGVTGLNRPVFWGFYITNFVFFIGISHAGTLISAILRIVNAEWRRTITRSAEVITVMVLLFGVGNILIDLGRPDRMLNVVKHGQLRSPLLWEHSAGMEKAMKQRGMEWPELGDDDLLNIIAYVRSASASGAKTYLKPGSPARGQGLFAERKCTECHVSGGGPKEKGPDLSRIELSRSRSTA